MYERNLTQEILKAESRGCRWAVETQDKAWKEHIQRPHSDSIKTETLNASKCLLQGGANADCAESQFGDSGKPGTGQMSTWCGLRSMAWSHFVYELDSSWPHSLPWGMAVTMHVFEDACCQEKREVQCEKKCLANCAWKQDSVTGDR